MKLDAGSELGHAAAVPDAAAPPHLALRDATAINHTQVDRRFGGFDLTDRSSYRAFLLAHSRALPAVEQVLTKRPGLPPFAPRTGLLAADLAALDAPMPETLNLAAPATEAAAWGMLYVAEGSRLGGVMLARSVPDSFPKAYLSASHARGGWRALLLAFDQAGEAGDAVWLAQATQAARLVFDLYDRAAEQQIECGIDR